MFRRSVHVRSAAKRKRFETETGQLQITLAVAETGLVCLGHRQRFFKILPDSCRTLARLLPSQAALVLLRVIICKLIPVRRGGADGGFAMRIKITAQFRNNWTGNIKTGSSTGASGRQRLNSCCWYTDQLRTN